MKSSHDHIKEEMSNPNIQIHRHSLKYSTYRNMYQPRMGATQKAKKENTKPKPHT